MSGESASVDDQIVPSLKFSAHSHGLKSLDDGRGKPPEINFPVRGTAGDKGEIDIAEIMEHGPAAGQSPDHGDVVFADVLFVDFGMGILILAHNNRRGITPEHKTVAVRVGEQILLCRQIERGIK